MRSLTASMGLLRVLSVASLSAAAVSPRPTISAGLALAGLLLLILSLTGKREKEKSNVILWAGAVAPLPLLLSRFESVGPLPASEAGIRPLWIALVLLTSGLAILSGRGEFYRRLALVTGAASVLLVTGVMTVAEWDSPVGFDVYGSHQAAGTALAGGENPYGDAVQTPNGSPHAPEGAVIIGYSYPPVVLSTYGLVASAIDPRVVSLLAWLGLLGWLARRAVIAEPKSNLSLAMFVVLCSAPVWPVVWFASWTEPLSLGLILLAALLWRPRPVLSAVVLGLALASKQYFIFLTPLVLLHRGERQIQRAIVAFGTAALTIVPAVVIDASAFFTATVGNLADIGFRPDTQSLSGLLAESGIDLQLPLVAWIALGLAFSVIISRASKTPGDFVLYASLILGSVFLIGQAFPNYWFLIMGLVAVGSVLTSTTAMAPETAAFGLASHGHGGSNQGPGPLLQRDRGSQRETAVQRRPAAEADQ